MPKWPSGLQQNLNVENFSNSMQDALLRSSVDAGPSKVRRRFSAVTEYVQGSIIIDTNIANKVFEDGVYELGVYMDKGYTFFIDFWKNKIKYGAIPFEWKHPLTEEPATFRLKNWRISARLPMYYVVDLDLEILP